MDKDPKAFSPRPGGIVAELVQLDQDVMKLLVRRAKLVSKMRGGRKHAATPQAVKSEKEVRLAWEQNAIRFSRDARFTRQLFSLLQELEMSTRQESEERGTFNLAPARRPVAVDLPGPAAVRATRLWATLAAASGSALQLDQVLLGDALIEHVKALNQAGAHLSWTADSSLANAGGAPLVFADKVFYAGEDTLTFHLLAFMAAGHTGKVRFTGGSALKMADLTPLRRFLPLLGARLAHSVPKSTGLPAAIEASGAVPEQVTLPADLPLDALSALFCAAATWPRPVRFDLSGLPAATSAQALAEVLPLLRSCGMEAAVHGTELRLDPALRRVPEKPALPLDPAVSVYLLALPAFAGGNVTLRGLWDPHCPEAPEAATLLRSIGLTLELTPDAVRVALSEGSAQATAFSRPLDCQDLPEHLRPLGLALAALAALRSLTPVPAPLLGPDLDPAMAQDFLDQLGLIMADGQLQKSDPASQEAVHWSCPGPYWGMAFALCAYVRPHLHLINPAAVTDVMPSFWALYNSLPTPSLRGKAKEDKAAPARRRIITESYSSPDSILEDDPS